MMAQQPGWFAVSVALHLAVGIMLGVLYFRTMWRSVRTMSGPTLTKAALLAILARFAVLACVLVLISLQGATALLATAAGLMIGRFIVMRGVRGTSA